MANDKKQLDDAIETAGRNAGADDAKIAEVRDVGEALLESGVPGEVLRATAPAQFDDATENLRRERRNERIGDNDDDVFSSKR